MDAYEQREQRLAAESARVKKRMGYWKRELLDTEVEFGASAETATAGRRKRDAQAMYLAFLEYTNGHHAACMASEISPSRVKTWLNTDPIFDKVVTAARQAATDRLVAEATRRAVDGVEKAVRHQGKVVGFERVYSDSVLIKLLAGLDPARFGAGTGGTDSAGQETKARRDAAKAILAGNPEALELAEKLADVLSQGTAD